MTCARGGCGPACPQKRGNYAAIVIECYTAVRVVDGKVHSITEDVNAFGAFGVNVLHFKNAVIMPGLIDVHVHLNEPGREEWEGELGACIEAQPFNLTLSQRLLAADHLLANLQNTGIIMHNHAQASLQALKLLPPAG